MDRRRNSHAPLVTLPLAWKTHEWKDVPGQTTLGFHRTALHLKPHHSSSAMGGHSRHHTSGHGQDQQALADHGCCHRPRPSDRASFAAELGPIAGAIGRALLYMTIVHLARKSLKPEITMTPHKGIMESLALALAVGLPLFATDQLLIQIALLPLLRLPVLLAVFTTSYLILSRYCLSPEVILMRFHSQLFALPARLT